MAVEMVRKPSETPNIENVDDFMPIRYAYANQNGYVIGNGAIGTGIDANAYTINGNTFTIHSGRLVLQGVECDIKNDHPVVIDINSTKRYCAIYLEVNLERNTSDIFVAYDMLGTPNVDAGDDLTANKIGTARMVLFTFEVTNGIISNVVKVVRACEYSLPMRLDENGVLRYGDTVIPQKKLLWETEEERITTVELGAGVIKEGDVLEIHGFGYENYTINKVRVSANRKGYYLYYNSTVPNANTIRMASIALLINVTTGTIEAQLGRDVTINDDEQVVSCLPFNAYIRKVYKIIE